MKKIWSGKKSSDERIVIVNDDAPNSSKSDIFHCNNSINFYSEIDDSSVNNLINILNEKSDNAHAIQYQFQLTELPPINLHIQSYGGVIFSGVAAMEAIRNNKVPINTYIDGVAASAATFLSIVGNKRYMYKESCIMIHQLSTGFWGKFDDLEDEFLNCKMLMEKLKRIYKQYTKMDDKFLNCLMKKDIYLESKDALKYGIVDEIIS